jgi:hypothetical protein
MRPRYSPRVARVTAAPFARGYPRRFTFYVAHPIHSILTSYFLPRTFQDPRHRRGGTEASGG